MYDDPCTGSFRWSCPWTKLLVITLKTPSECGPPWIGIRSPPRVTYWTEPSCASNGIFALRRSVIASPSAVCTFGLRVFSVFGVLTGSFASNCMSQGLFPTGAPGTGAAFAYAQKRRHKRAPFDVESSRLSHPASAVHALPISTGPFELGA